MRRKEEWARPEWTLKVNKAVEKASVERDSSRTLIGSAEDELEQVLEQMRALVSSKARAAA
jgi:hypothetical protein